LKTATIPCESKEFVAVSWLKESRHPFYEDSFRMLSRDIPIVGEQNRGEIFAVFDGSGSAPDGRQAAWKMADCLLEFYRKPGIYPSLLEGVRDLLLATNMDIFNWGFMPGTDKPKGGCAGTVVWIIEDQLYMFHAGDTTALLI
jgi:PPM family protein phosphatase